MPRRANPAANVTNAVEGLLQAVTGLVGSVQSTLDSGRRVGAASAERPPGVPTPLSLPCAERGRRGLERGAHRGRVRAGGEDARGGAVEASRERCA